MANNLKVEDGLYGIIGSPNIAKVRFGKWEIDAWYGSAVYFARDKKSLGFKYSNLPHSSRSRIQVDSDEIWLKKLYVCDTCFKYTDVSEEFEEHLLACEYANKQLGKIMYKDNEYTIRRVRGSKNKLFTQNLCLFTKLFLDNKSVYFTVEYFQFYIIYDNENNKPMGFFSRELLSWDKNNLACILVFPPYQRRHLGTLLIAFSYELSKSENLISGPEKPLSPFGLVGYLRYWSAVITRELLFGSTAELETITINHLSKTTGIRTDDISMTLKYMQVLMKDDKSTLFIQKDVIKNWAFRNKINFNPLLQKEGLLID